MQTQCGEMIDILSCRTEDEANIVVNDLLSKIESQSVDSKRKILATLVIIKTLQISRIKEETEIQAYRKIINLINTKINNL